MSRTTTFLDSSTMDNPTSQPDGRPAATQLPDWETPTDSQKSEGKGSQSSACRRSIVGAFFNRHIPPDRKYCGLRRRWALLSLYILLLVLVALIVGLSVGLTTRAPARDDSFLPLPSDSQFFVGDLTYYGPGLGACGATSGDGDSIVSVSHLLFDHVSNSSNPNSNPLCGMKIRAERFDEQVSAERSVDLTVVDRCI